MPTDKNILVMPEAEVKEIVKQTVSQVFLNLGINTSDPDNLVSFQQDMHFLRKERNRREAMGDRIFSHIVLLVVTAAATALGTLFLNGGL